MVGLELHPILCYTRSHGRPPVPRAARICRWIDDSAGVFAALPAILPEQDRLRERLDATERASSRLLQEVNDLRRELDALQSENESLRRERVETADSSPTASGAC